MTDYPWLALLALIFGPMILVGLAYLISSPFVIASQLFVLFTASTSHAQIPAYIARRLAKQGRVEDASRWYLEMLASCAYEKIVGLSLLGPRRQEIPQFLRSHGDRVPSDRREVLTNHAWADAFLRRNLEQVREWAADNAALLDLARQLTTSAHSPKEISKLKWLQECADACAATAPGLAAVLRQEITPQSKYVLKPLDSPVTPAKERLNGIRQEQGICSGCSTTNVVRGLDAYAQVKFTFEIPQGTSSYTYYISRFLGYFEVRFCGRCFPETMLAIAINRRKQRAWFFGVVGAGAVTLVATFAVLGQAGSVAGVLSAVLGIGAVATVVVCLVQIFRPRQLEARLCRSAVDRFISDQRGELLAACDLTGSVLHRDGTRHEPTPGYVEFVVEPWLSALDRGGTSFIDEGGVQWFKCP